MLSKSRRNYFTVPDTAMIAAKMETTQPSTKQDILHYLLKQGQGTAQELAAVLEMSPQAIRRHLKDLEGEALILRSPVQVGMGRPQYNYQLSKKGKERFPNRSSQFAVDFLDTVTETLGYEQASSLLRKHWEKKAQEYREILGKGSLSDRLSMLVELRKKEGYMADYHVLESNRFFLTEHHCAISNLAESFPGVCGHELEMFAAALPDCIVERTHWMNNGQHQCGYAIAVKPS